MQVQDRVDRAIVRGILGAMLLSVAACSVWCLSPASAPPRDVVGNGPGGPETCYRKDVAEASDRYRNIAIVRMSYCPGQDPTDVGYDFFIVFVHRAGEINSRDNIALQYVPAPTDLPTTTGQTGPAAPWFDELTQPPKVKWLGARQLEVGVPGIVETMVVQKDSIDGITVRYCFEGGPPKSWDAGLGGNKNNH